ncbi:MAG TPA: PEP-CTERM sorting domain-containing protein [Rhizomicrobium sp.]|nr:PEP-CTERM sorting domain-containing protein [Rhizomicrobium sp.]
MAIFGGAADAHISICFKNCPQQPGEQNILFGAKDNNLTSLTGQTKKTSTTVTFDVISGTEEIGTNGIGQADVICTMNCGTDSKGGANGMQLTNLDIAVQSGFGATDFIGNLDFGEGTALIDVTDQTGATFDYTLGNGQNFFTLTATGGEVITDIHITEEALNSKGFFGWNDLKQPRISGICTLTGDTCTPVSPPPPPPGIPEPSTVAVLGVGLLGTVWFVRRRKNRGVV